jgi:hypothetical protein
MHRLKVCATGRCQLLNSGTGFSLCEFSPVSKAEFFSALPRSMIFFFVFDDDAHHGPGSKL